MIFNQTNLNKGDVHNVMGGSEMGPINTTTIKDDRPKAFIMQGVPGSGKSTWVKNNARNGIVCSADKFHITPDGEYKYNPSKASQAHGQCLRDWVDGLKIRVPLIVCDNTNTTMWELAPYYRLAEAYDYNVEIVQVFRSIEFCVDRNVHGVPAHTIHRMADNIRAFNAQVPERWKLRLVVTKDAEATVTVTHSGMAV